MNIKCIKAGPLFTVSVVNGRTVVNKMKIMIMKLGMMILAPNITECFLHAGPTGHRCGVQATAEAASQAPPRASEDQAVLWTKALHCESHREVQRASSSAPNRALRP